MTRDELVSIIEQAAAAEGVPASALLAIANLESSGNVNARNPRSSASGAFQFVDSTAREYGLTGSKRNDPTAQAYAAARMMATNAQSLSRTLGREPTAGELYLAHQQGLGGATALLRNPGRNAVDVLAEVYGSRSRAEQAVRLNGGKPGQTAGQFAGQWVEKANQTAARIPPASIPNTVGTQVDVAARAVAPSMPTPVSQRPAAQPPPAPSAVSRLAPTTPITPRLTEDGSDIYSYHIPGMTPTVVTGGLGSLTPDPVARTAASPLDPGAMLPGASPPLPRPRPAMGSDPGGGAGVTVARVPTTPAAPVRLPPIVPSREQVEAATGFRVGTSAPPPVASMTREEIRADNGQTRPATVPRAMNFSTLPGPDNASKPEDRLTPSLPGLTPVSGTVQPNQRQVEAGTGFRLGSGSSPLTEEVEVENPAYARMMERVRQGELELRGMTPSGMPLSRDGRARWEASRLAIEQRLAQERQQLANMQRTVTVSRTVRQPTAPVRPVDPMVASGGRLTPGQIAAALSNPSNHNSAALAAISQGRTSYTGSDGGLQPTVSISGRVRNTYGD